MAEPATRTMTPAEFFAWQERQDELYELVRGVPVPRGGAARTHTTVRRVLARAGAPLRAIQPNLQSPQP